MSEKVIQSYVWYKDNCFFVSTIERDSVEPGFRYNETIVWEYDYDKRERKRMVSIHEDSTGCLDEHLDVCKHLYKFGHGNISEIPF